MDLDELRTVAAVRRMLRSGEAREMRIAAQVSVSELAQVVGVSEGTLWRWENGTRVPRPAQAVALAVALEALSRTRP